MISSVTLASHDVFDEEEDEDDGASFPETTRSHRKHDHPNGGMHVTYAAATGTL